jgi:hypothetical protein
MMFHLTNGFDDPDSIDVAHHRSIWEKIVRNVLCLEIGCLDSGCHYFMKAEAEHRSNEYIDAPS